MKRGELKNAQRRALNILDAWLNATGAISRESSWYYELQGIVEDAVECGAQAATRDFHALEGEDAAYDCVYKEPTDVWK